VRDRRLPASDPDRVRHSNRIGFEVFGLPFKEVLEIRTADFLFQFPDKLNIYGSTVFNGVSRPEQSRKCRTFVVGCPPPDIPVPVFMEYKRSTPPLRLVCRLDVKVVVDGNGWPVRSRYKLSDNNGIAGRRDGFGLGSERSQVLYCGIGGPMNIGLVF